MDGQHRTGRTILISCHRFADRWPPAVPRAAECQQGDRRPYLHGRFVLYEPLIPGIFDITATEPDPAAEWHLSLNPFNTSLIGKIDFGMQNRRRHQSLMHPNSAASPTPKIRVPVNGSLVEGNSAGTLSCGIDASNSEEVADGQRTEQEPAAEAGGQEAAEFGKPVVSFSELGGTA